MYDIIIKNGLVVDGTGKEPFLADIGIKENVIVDIGELHEEKSGWEINAEGKIVCPGFIDVTNHSDTFWQIFLDPDLESLVYQGITTIVGGACGSSLAPLATPKTIESIQKWTDLKQVNINWLSLEEFFNFLSVKKISLNFATLVGHETLRRGLIGDELRSPNPKELRFMEKMLKTSLKEGALGMSTGLVYTHARMATEQELLDLAKIVKKFNGIYTTHIRDETDEMVASVEEAIRIAERSKARLHITHLKAMGKNNWAQMDEALEVISWAEKNKIEISFDVYPYTNTGSVLYTLLPTWASEGGKKMMLHRLKDLAIRTKIVEEMKNSSFEYDKVEIANSPLNKTLTRRKITEIAASRKKSVEEAIIDLLIASGGRVITSMEVLSEENVEKAIRHPLSIISSNGSGYSIDHARTGEEAHPRSFGTFIKVLSHYVFEKNLLTFPEAIKKMTSTPAKIFGLKKRGSLKEGNFADILVLDKNKLSSPSTKRNPYQYSRGVEYMLINGEAVIWKGTYTGIRNGKIIRR
jgi:N-acyl-D-amino-acid deacylase